MNSRANLLWAITEALKNMSHDDLERVYDFVRTLNERHTSEKENPEEKSKIRERFIDEIERVKEQGRHKPGSDTGPQIS